MAISKEDVQYISHLAKLKFSDEEAIDFAKEFENILNQFKTIDNLQLDDVEIEMPKEAILRKDIHKKCEMEDLFKNTKVTRETYIEVPKIIE